MTRIHRPSVFLSAVAQYDNLGDLLIRRSVATWVQEFAEDIHVLASGSPESFVDALELPPRASIHRTGSEFWRAFAHAAVTRRACLVLSPGPTTAPVTVKQHARSLANEGLVRVNSLLGGQSFAVGRSFRTVDGQKGLARERRAIRAMHLYGVRDQTSAELLGSGVEVTPDMAFLNADPQVGRRDRLAISLRGDKPIDSSLLGSVLEWARSADLDPILVTQVKHDNDAHERYAASHGIELLAWQTESHGQQLARVKAAYSSARYVLTNRLHAAIIGAMSGAAPLIVAGGTDKVTGALTSRLTFRVIDSSVGLPPRSEFEADGDRVAAEARAASQALRLFLDQSAVRLRLSSSVPAAG